MMAKASTGSSTLAHTALLHSDDLDGTVCATSRAVYMYMYVIHAIVVMVNSS